ncbi:MAG: M24 family metallopeptidase, partial [Pseudomonadota bacterium]
IGSAQSDVKAAHARLVDAADTAFEITRPGVTAAQLFDAMNAVLSEGGAGTDAGRLGHGLGMSLTEWPSIIPTDDTELVSGMVLTLEPGISVNGKILVHEENIVVTEAGARYLSPRIGPALVEL